MGMLCQLVNGADMPPVVDDPNAVVNGIVPSRADSTIDYSQGLVIVGNILGPATGGTVCLNNITVPAGIRTPGACRGPERKP